MAGNEQEHGVLIADSGELQQQDALNAGRGARRSTILASLGLSALAVLALPQSRALTFASVKREGPALDIDSVVALTSASDSADMLDAVNRERQQKGLSGLCYNDKLNKAAERQANDMYSKQFTDHTGSDGSKLAGRISDAGYSWGNSASENIASGTSVSQVVNAWMNNDGLKGNILNHETSQLGMARQGDYWSLVLASPLGDEACAPTPATPAPPPVPPPAPLGRNRCCGKGCQSSEECASDLFC